MRKILLWKHSYVCRGSAEDGNSRFLNLLCVRLPGGVAMELENGGKGLDKEGPA